MDNTYVISWKSKTEARFGQGSKLFARAEAEALAEELNEDYPAFIHEAHNLAASAEIAPLAQAPETAAEPSIIEIDFQPVAPEVCGVCEPSPALVEAVLDMQMTEASECAAALA